MNVGEQSHRWGDGSISIPVLRSAASDDLYDLHLAAIEYTLASPITIRGKEDIKSARHWSEVLEPYEHQVRNLITFCRRAPVALIADDVGLGKTISAGLILSELMTRKKVQRALILAPKLLLPQWCEELQAKFKIEARHASGGELEFLLRSSVPVVVTTYETARGRMGDLAKSFFDMLILDEAHKLRNLHGTQQAPRIAQVLHKSLRDREFKYVVMLTATPIQNRLWDIYSLVDCLATARGHQNPLGSPGEFSSYFVRDAASTARELHPGRREEFRRRISEYIVRTSRRDSRLIFPDRKVQNVGCPPGAAETGLTKLVSEALPSLNALARSSLAEALMSSPAALVAQLRNMAANGTVPASAPAQAESLAAQVGSGGCKLEKLRAIIAELRREKGADWRIVLFTRRKETQDLIGKTLTSEGVRIGFIRGGQAEANQRAIEALRAEPPGINLLVSTDSGAEGVNLQAANIIVNYDLPWNPMVVEQRIGRIQRLASKHKFIIVVNLVVSGSVEETVVIRLIAKLQAVSQTIGDIEGILESTSLGEDQFEDTIRDLVLKALMGQNVAEATEQIRQSIERAKAAYEEEKGEVERNLGALDAMHTAGPSLPDLEDVIPRLTVEEFVQRALSGNGVSLTRMDDGRWLGREEGRSPIIVTFNEGDPDLQDDGLAGFHRQRAVLYQEGRPAFERLVGEWAKRDAVRIADLRDVGGTRVREAVDAWAASLGPDAEVVGWTQDQTKARFGGQVSLRGSSSVAHDRYEKLVSVSMASPAGPLEAPLAMPPEEWVRGEVDLRRSVDGIEILLRDAVEDDKDIAAFCQFYDGRRKEEVAKAQGDARRAEVVGKHFAPALAAEVVAARGHLYEEVSGTAGLRLAGGGPYPIALTILPFARRVLAEPERVVCETTGRRAPLPCFGRCEISGKRVLRHLLVSSERSGRVAIEECTRTCAVSSRRLLSDEVAASDLSGRIVDVELLHPSAVSGKRGLADEMVRCEFTQARLLASEAARSDVSARRFRSDEEARSAVSGVRGHRSEFVKCQSSGDWALPTEVASSSVSGKVVRKELLVGSEKDRSRVGLQEETATCVLSGKRLLIDEVEKSVVSGSLADMSLMAHSTRSKSPALPSELVRCEVSGAMLLPSETGTCAVSGMRLDTTLLGVSDFSKRTVQQSLLHRCPETGRQGLEVEMGRCSVTRQLVDPRQLVECAVTGKLVLSRLTTCCAVSGRTLLREYAVTAQSGRVGHPDTADRCAWSGWILLSDEVRPCRITGASLSKAHVHESGVSLAHAELLRDHQSLVPVDGAISVDAQSLLEASGHKASRIWARKSPSTSTVAVVGECRSLFGLRRRCVVCYMDTDGKSLVGRTGLVDVRAGKW